MSGRVIFFQSNKEHMVMHGVNAFGSNMSLYSLLDTRESSCRIYYCVFRLL